MKHLWVTTLLLLGVAGACADDYLVYFGTYTGAKSKGIYVSRFDSTTGKLSGSELAAETKNPSFLALHPKERFLYAVGEVDRTQGKPGGAVNAFAIDGQTGKLTLLNQQASGGTGPCHVSVDATGKCVLVANYGSGSVAALPIKTDGGLDAAATTIQHSGSSINLKRQAGPHAHFITPSPDNRFVLACDLGLDKVFFYKLDATHARLATNNRPRAVAYAVVPPGSGPRHLAFHPNGRFVYVINEMALTITAFKYNSKRGVFSEEAGAFSELQNVFTVPADYAITEKDSTAEIAVHPNGKFVYGSNRGHDSIAVFSADEWTGKLTLVQNESTQGKTPRHFAIDPTGKWLLAENQNSDSVVVFAIDAATGKLKPTGQTLTVGSPVCAVFVKAH